MKSGNFNFLEPSGPLQAWWDCFTFTFLFFTLVSSVEFWVLLAQTTMQFGQFTAPRFFGVELPHCRGIKKNAFPCPCASGRKTRWLCNTQSDGTEETCCVRTVNVDCNVAHVLGITYITSTHWELSSISHRSLLLYLMFGKCDQSSTWQCALVFLHQYHSTHVPKSHFIHLSPTLHNLN